MVYLVLYYNVDFRESLGEFAATYVHSRIHGRAGLTENADILTVIRDRDQKVLLYGLSEVGERQDLLLWNI